MGDADPGKARDVKCRTQRWFSSEVRKRAPQTPGRRAKKSHPTSRWWRHRRPAPPRSRKDRRASSQCRRGVGKLAAEIHSTGGFGRPMSVNRGKRMWRIPTPHLSITKPARAARKGWTARSGIRPPGRQLPGGLFVFHCEPPPLLALRPLAHLPTCPLPLAIQMVNL